MNRRQFLKSTLIGIGSITVPLSCRSTDRDTGVGYGGDYIATPDLSAYAHTGDRCFHSFIDRDGSIYFNECKISGGTKSPAWHKIVIETDGREPEYRIGYITRNASFIESD